MGRGISCEISSLKKEEGEIRTREPGGVDLKSTAFDHSATSPNMFLLGLEPRSHHVYLIFIVLQEQIKIRCRESNPRRLGENQTCYLLHHSGEETARGGD
jgi:hypothetical protein